MDYTFVSKYARWIPEKKRRETWNEAVDRVKQMMLEKYADQTRSIARSRMGIRTDAQKACAWQSTRPTVWR